MAFELVHEGAGVNEADGFGVVGFRSRDRNIKKESSACAKALGVLEELERPVCWSWESGGTSGR